LESDAEAASSIKYSSLSLGTLQLPTGGHTKGQSKPVPWRRVYP